MMTEVKIVVIFGRGNWKGTSASLILVLLSFLIWVVVTWGCSFGENSWSRLFIIYVLLWYVCY